MLWTIVFYCHSSIEIRSQIRINSINWEFVKISSIAKGKPIPKLWKNFAGKLLILFVSHWQTNRQAKITLDKFKCFDCVVNFMWVLNSILNASYKIQPHIEIKLNNRSCVRAKRFSRVVRKSIKETSNCIRSVLMWKVLCLHGILRCSVLSRQQ